MDKDETRSFFSAKNLRRKEGRASVSGVSERTLAEEARQRRRGLCGEGSQTRGAFGKLTGAEYNKHVVGTTGDEK